MSDLLLFSHANGFPAPVYRVMLEQLSARYRIERPERIGHDPRYPVTLDWPHLVEELAERAVAAAGDARRIFLVGHSLGGYLSLLAAHRLAGTALAARLAGVVMLDSPLIAGWRARLVQLGRRTGLDNLVMPTRATLQRRRHWPDRAAVRALPGQADLRALGPARAQRLRRARHPRRRRRRARASVRARDRIPHLPQPADHLAERAGAASAGAGGLPRRHPLARAAQRRRGGDAASGRRALGLGRRQPPVPDGAAARYGRGDRGDAEADRAGGRGSGRARRRPSAPPGPDCADRRASGMDWGFSGFSGGSGRSR
ncbi:alpha/beta hydrolase [Lysobacter enzymogenes]|nr:alpha/beta hydrolase [Lysobacter enzymogenes]